MICILLSVTLYASVSATTLTYETAIAVKQGVQDYSNPIAMGVENYEDFVKRSKLFVDNTLLIKEMLTFNKTMYNIAVNQYPMQMYYIGPRKRGKTLNVNMFIKFIEMEIDEDAYDIEDYRKTRNYQLFVKGEIPSNYGTVEKLEKPLLISNHMDVVKQHMSKYPVVYVDFKDVKGDNFKEVIRSLCDAVNRAFLRNWFVMKRIRYLRKDKSNAKRNHAKYFITEVNETMSDARCTPALIPYQIHFLCEVFFKIYDKKSYVILDNYDKPITNILRSKNFPRDDVDEFLEIMDLLADNSLQRNKYREDGFAIGEYELEQFGPFLRWSSYKLMDLAVSSHPISQYFGFNQRDVEGLFDKLKVPVESRERAHKWYNGYATENHDRRIYNPFSVSSFLNNQKIRSYWTENEEREIITNLCEKRLDVRIELLTLLSKQKIRVNVKREMGEDELYNLKLGQDYAAYEDLLWYLFRMGYLTYHSRKNSAEQITYQGGSVTAKVPNNEIASHIASWLVSYYQRTYKIQHDTLLGASVDLLQMVNDTDPSTTLLEVSLTRMYGQCTYTELPTNANTSLVEDPLHAIFTCVALEMQRHSWFEIDVYYNKIMTADIVIVNHYSKMAFAIDINREDTKSSENPYQVASTRKQIMLSKLPNVKTLKSIAVKISLSKTVHIIMNKE